MASNCLRFALPLLVLAASTISCEADKTQGPGVQMVACADGTGNADCCPAEVAPAGKCTREAQECWTKCFNGLHGHLVCSQASWLPGEGLFSCEMDASASDANPVDASIDSSIDATDASDPCSDPIVPGVHICCGRPGEAQGENCIARSTIDFNLAHCVQEGLAFDAKDRSVGLFCCQGLQQIEYWFPADADGGGGEPGLPINCSSGPVSAVRCTKCGDGSCGPGENRCNCPMDCDSQP
jgi:hypothetical protein